VTRAAGHEEALAEIAAIDDPAKLDALDFAIKRACRKAPPELALGLYRAHVTALSHMPQHVATLRLLNYAVLATSEEMRMRAAKALSPRPATDYVPLLMAALTAPVEADTVVFAAPDGTVRMFETIHQDGPDVGRTHTRSLNLETEGALHFNKATSNPAAVLRGNLATAEAMASQTRERVAAANAAAAERNKRIGAVLKGATGSDPGESAEKWWSAWLDYNELSSSASRQDYETYEDRSYTTYRYPQAQPRYPTPGGPKSGTTYTTSRPTATTPSAIPTSALPTTLIRRHECFAAGTRVWTQSGPRAIEAIEVGDLVLSQETQSGELAYRAVLETTTSDPVPVVQLKLPAETITSTLGHRFWVAGHGWRMAKALTPAVRLHAMNGGVELESAARAPAAVCYNLVVDGFHTFFVGETRLLVHDKTCPAPNPHSLPGARQLRQKSPGDIPLSDALVQAGNPQAP
jgi:hypothetical protein